MSDRLQLEINQYALADVDRIVLEEASRGGNQRRTMLCCWLAGYRMACRHVAAQTLDAKLAASDVEMKLI